MEDRDMESFKTLQKKKDRSYATGTGIRGNMMGAGRDGAGGAGRDRIQQLIDSANGATPIRARYRNSRKQPDTKNNESEHGKKKQGM